MKKELGRKFWAAMLIFGLVGQIAWVVENMYLNVFLYKMFHASAADISLMVGASSVAATLTTILVGALSDKLGKRKVIICLGYIVWGISILGFAFIKVETLTPIAGGAVQAAALGVTLTIALDCIMTFFGSAANDAAFNAWLTDKGGDGNRGKIEGFNSMMPLVSILVVFGGFMGFNLDLAESWTTIFYIIGGVVIVIGILGFFLIEEAETTVKETDQSYWGTVIYSFKPSVIRNHKLLYCVLGAFALFGISIQTYMPYLILYYEKSLNMANYVLIMAPAIILAAVATALYGKVYDMQGFKGSISISIGVLLAGYVILLFTRTTVPVFIGSLFMMTGYMTGMSVFGAMIRDNIPENKSGQFQGIRIIGQVLVPGIIGPAIGAFVLRDAEQILNNDGTYSFLPNANIWMAAIVTGLVLCVGLKMIFTMMRVGHYDLLSETGEEFIEEKQMPWQEYPRPQMRRDKYCLLNGTWKCNGSDILVPFAPQASLSGYGKKVDDKLVYEKTFVIPKDFNKEKILLHFGAVDQIATIWVNGEKLGSHEGGYLPFSLDITKVVKRDGENQLKVEVIDTLSKDYPYGKQTKKRGGMWYTPVSGIWQTVWLEEVPDTYIEKIVMTPDLKGVDIELVINDTNGDNHGETNHACGKAAGFDVSVELEPGNVVTKHFEGNKGRLEIDGMTDSNEKVHVAKLWTTETPHLYPINITYGKDRVDSYFALRTIAIEKQNGVNRVVLNGKPIFMHAVLDQGYFCDGLFLPAKAEEYEKDILRMKELGYNMLRKHIKIEPEAFYYACDGLGMLVMQDMVNNGGYNFIFDTALPTLGFKTKNDAKGKIEGKQKEFFKQHTKETIEHLYNHPSIVAYTIFNEGWGQFNSDEMYDYVKELDPTRLADSTSGWFAQKKNDFDSEHIYFKVIPLEPKERPLFVSECGGYTMAAEGHYYSKYAQYGYGASDTKEALTKDIVYMYENMIIPYVKNGVCGCVYTQLSDVEDEINGLYTYDRKVCKVVKEDMLAMAEKIYAQLEV
ncbi:MAG: MFS transporter [Lachnospiraceae bacterium]|nr:MFS transporter [Lachnospiraceae bacterium]